MLLLFYLISYLCKAKKILCVLLVAAFCLALGYTSSSLRVDYIKSPSISKKYEKLWIKGIVESIEEADTSKRLIMNNLKIKGIVKSETPKKIRVNTKTNITQISVGDKVAFFATLIPPPHEVVPNGFNFAKFAYFKQIGAIGYTISHVKIIQKRDDDYADLIKKIRIAILESIKRNIEQPAAGIAIALLVGDTTKISKKEYEDIKTSGISHLLAISGRHITLVASLLFISSRFILVRIQSIALRVNCKKLAAIIEIIGTLFYLLITGCPVSAQRAFYMTALVLFGLVIDRVVRPMRTISIAAIIIFIALPETILNPSLQMSLSACLGLIFGFNYISKKFSSYKIFNNYYLDSSCKYLAYIVAATLLATITTTPFIAYHFRYFSTYSIVSNLLIIPINDFLVMPLGIIGVMLMPINLEFIGFKLMNLGINFILFLTNFISNLPESAIKMPHISDTSVLAFTLSGLSLIMMKTNLRYISVIFLLLGILLSCYYTPPDILISESGNTVAIKNGGKILFLYSGKGERYIKKVWSEEFNIQKDLIKNKFLNDKKNLSCNDNYCIYQNNLKAILVKNHSYLQNKCSAKPDIFINLSKDTEFQCKSSAINLNKKNFINNGAYAIWLHNDYPIINYVMNNKKHKPWERKTNRF